MDNKSAGKSRLKKVSKSFKEYLNELFNLSQDKERDLTTIAEISRGVEFKGPHLWILLFAMLIASIGLNINSTAVVIGAMLISPLMGPIMGIGLGAGINDFALIKKSAKNLGVAAFLCILTSALYFYITPLHEAQSELLSRTQPTLWDVLIASFGGFAGIVAGSRREKSNAIPGVAIATALMPPLCTAGYGLANGNWFYMIGALYLFFINGVFISFATFIIVRALKYPRKQFSSPEVEQRVKRYIYIFVICTAIPSVYLAYGVVQRTIFTQNALLFINSEFDMPSTDVINQKLVMREGQGIISLTLYGKTISPDQLDRIKKRMVNYNLNNVELIIKQGQLDEYITDTKLEFARMSDQLKISIIQDLYKDNAKLIQDKEDRIRFLENELIKYHVNKYPVSDIQNELAIYYPALVSLSMGDLITANQDTICHVVLKFKQNPTSKDKNAIQNWLKIRTKVDQIKVLIES